MQTIPPLVVATVSPVNQLPLVPQGRRNLIGEPLRVGTLGRTLYEVYSVLGSTAEKHANRAAHSLGMGPHAVTQRIQDFFGDGVGRESKLLELGTMDVRKLEKDCVRLMTYALP
jgi:hypothetical protein